MDLERGNDHSTSASVVILEEVVSFFQEHLAIFDENGSEEYGPDEQDTEQTDAAAIQDGQDGIAISQSYLAAASNQLQLDDIAGRLHDAESHFGDTLLRFQQDCSQRERELLDKIANLQKKLNQTQTELSSKEADRSRLLDTEKEVSFLKEKLEEQFEHDAELKKRISEAEKSLKDAAEREDGFRQRIASLERNLEEMTAKDNDLSTKISQMESNASQSNEEVAARVRELEEKCQSFEIREEELLQRLSDQETTLKSTSEEKANLLNDLSAKEEILLRKENELSNLRKDFEAKCGREAEMERKVENLQQNMLKLDTENHRLLADFSTSKSKLAEVNESHQKLAERIADLETSLEQAVEDKKKLLDDLSAKEEFNQQVFNELSMLKQQLEFQSTEEERLLGKASESEETLVSVQSENERLISELSVRESELAEVTEERLSLLERIKDLVDKLEKKSKVVTELSGKEDLHEQELSLLKQNLEAKSTEEQQLSGKVVELEQGLSKVQTDYQRLLSELDSAQTTVLDLQTASERLMQQLKDSEKQVAVVSAELAEKTVALDNLRAEFQKETSDYEETKLVLESRIAEQLDQITSLNLRNEEHLSTIAMSEEKLSESVSQVDTLKQLLQEREDELKGLQITLTEKDDSIAQLEKDFLSAREDFKNEKQERLDANSTLEERLERATLQLEEQTTEITELKKEIEQLQAAKETLNNQLMEYSLMLDDANTRNSSLEGELCKSKDELVESSSLYSTALEETNLLKEEIHVLRERCEFVENEYAALTVRFKEAENKLDQMESAGKANCDLLDKLQSENASLAENVEKHRIEKDRIDEEIVVAQDRCKCLELEIAQKDDELNELKSSMSKLEGRLTENVQQNADLQADIAELSETVNQLKQSLFESQAALSSAVYAETTTAELNASLTSRIDELQSSIHEKQSQIATVESRLAESEARLNLELMLRNDEAAARDKQLAAVALRCSELFVGLEELRKLKIDVDSRVSQFRGLLAGCRPVVSAAVTGSDALRLQLHNTNLQLQELKLALRAYQDSEEYLTEELERLKAEFGQDVSWIEFDKERDRDTSISHTDGLRKAVSYLERSCKRTKDLSRTLAVVENQKKTLMDQLVSAEEQHNREMKELVDKLVAAAGGPPEEPSSGRRTEVETISHKITEVVQVELRNGDVQGSLEDFLQNGMSEMGEIQSDAFHGVAVDTSVCAQLELEYYQKNILRLGAFEKATKELEGYIGELEKIVAERNRHLDELNQENSGLRKVVVDLREQNSDLDSEIRKLRLASRQRLSLPVSENFIPCSTSTPLRTAAPPMPGCRLDAPDIGFAMPSPLSTPGFDRPVGHFFGDNGPTLLMQRPPLFAERQASGDFNDSVDSADSFVQKVWDSGSRIRTTTAVAELKEQLVKKMTLVQKSERDASGREPTSRPVHAVRRSTSESTQTIEVGSECRLWIAFCLKMKQLNQLVRAARKRDRNVRHAVKGLAHLDVLQLIEEHLSVLRSYQKEIAAEVEEAFLVLEDHRPPVQEIVTITRDSYVLELLGVAQSEADH